MKVNTIVAGYFKLDGGAMHGVVPKSMWQKVNPADENNMCSWAMRCIVIEHEGRLILVDNGMGDKQDAKFFSHFQPHGDVSLQSELNRLGYTPDDITDVLLTHLHFDHCGGSVKRDGDKLVTTFRNAKYWTNKAHWDWALTPNPREKASFLKENMLPIQECGQLNFIETADGAEWLPDIKLHFVNGHTEQMMLPEIKYKDNTFLFCADLFPSAAHISLPWVMAYDMRPLDTLKEKEVMLQKAVENNWNFIFQHDPKIACANLTKDEHGRIRMNDTFRLEDLG